MPGQALSEACPGFFPAFFPGYRIDKGNQNGYIIDMKINTKIRYGLRMLVILAEKGTVVNTGELGEAMMVSPKYLRKLAGPLEKDNLIRSVQGIYGGYQLGRQAEEISLADIFGAFKERIDISSCTGGKSCPLNADCLTRPVWEHLENIIEKEFYRISLKDILTRQFVAGT